MGKSSLVNRLLGFERVVANPLAGTTRDSVDTPFTYQQQALSADRYRRNPAQRKGQSEAGKISVIQALKAMDRAHVVLVVIDAEEGITDQDLTVAGYALEKGRAVILVVNKWDLVEKDNATMGQLISRGCAYLSSFSFCPSRFRFRPDRPESAKIMAMSKRWQRNINAGSHRGLNRVLSEAAKSHQPPVFQGKRLKFFYMTQIAVRPPTFVIFVNKADGVHFSYERFLVNQLRRSRSVSPAARSACCSRTGNARDRVKAFTSPVPGIY